METITRKINGRECQIVLTDNMFEMISELQGTTEIDRNEMVKSRVKLLEQVVRRLTTDYDPEEAHDILKIVSGINNVCDIISSLSAPESK